MLLSAGLGSDTPFSYGFLLRAGSVIFTSISMEPTSGFRLRCASSMNTETRRMLYNSFFSWTLAITERSRGLLGVRWSSFAPEAWIGVLHPWVTVALQSFFGALVADTPVTSWDPRWFPAAAATPPRVGPRTFALHLFIHPFPAADAARAATLRRQPRLGRGSALVAAPVAYSDSTAQAAASDNSSDSGVKAWEQVAASFLPQSAARDGSPWLSTHDPRSGRPWREDHGRVLPAR